MPSFDLEAQRNALIEAEVVPEWEQKTLGLKILISQLG